MRLLAFLSRCCRHRLLVTVCLAATALGGACGIGIRRDLATIPPGQVGFDDMCGLQDYFDTIEAKLASDGITEILDTWLPAGRRKGAADHTGMIALHATDLEQVWYVRLRGVGVALLDTDTLLDSDDHHERATASGSASDVLLALYGRISYDALTVGGDLALLEGLRVG